MRKIIAYFCLFLIPLTLFSYSLLPVNAQTSSEPSPNYSFLLCRADDGALEATFEISPDGIDITGFQYGADNIQPFGFRGTFKSFVEQPDYLSLPVEIKSDANPENSPRTFVPRGGFSNYIQDLRIYQQSNSPTRLVIAEIDGTSDNRQTSRQFMNCKVSNLALIKQLMTNRSFNAYDCQCAQTSGNRMALSVPFISLIDLTEKSCKYSRSGGELTCRRL